MTVVYGMTETSPVSTQTRAGDSLERRVSTVGRVHPHVEIKIIDPETGVTVPRGVAGELCTRGYSVMLGYWQQPDKTAEAIDGARWMHTGDLATMDADGYVNITGRLKDMVIRGGENVSPREIEEYLHTHPDVRDVQIIGVPDARLGEEIMAWIRLRPGARPMTAADIRAYADGKLARYKIPRYVRIVDDFPMTASGKVRKVGSTCGRPRSKCSGSPTSRHPSTRSSHPLEDPMTTNPRTRRVNLPAYYLGPSVWIAALAPQSATHESSGVSDPVAPEIGAVCTADFVRRQPQRATR